MASTRVDVRSCDALSSFKRLPAQIVNQRKIEVWRYGASLAFKRHAGDLQDTRHPAGLMRRGPIFVRAEHRLCGTC